MWGLLFLGYIFPSVITQGSQDFKLTEKLLDFHGHASANIILKDPEKTNLKMLMKTFSVKIHDLVVQSPPAFGKKPDVFYLLLPNDDLTLQTLYNAWRDNQTRFAEIVWFVKVKEANKIIHNLRYKLRFDSSFYLLEDISENMTNIIEVYSITQDLENISVKTHIFGIWEEGEIKIKETNKWNRRTDLFGSKLR